MAETIDQEKAVPDEPMQQRQIILEDGRYVIFYSFGRSEAPASESVSKLECLAAKLPKEHSQT